MAKYTLHPSVIKIIDTLHSETLKTAVKDFIDYTPIDFTVLSNGALRTPELQNSLFKKGYSQLDGYKYKSKHQTGLAVDLVPWVNGKPTWERDYIMRLSGAFSAFLKISNIDYINGADWNNDGDLSVDSWDGVHFEVKE